MRNKALILTFLLPLLASVSLAQVAVVTYQGKLTNGGNAANGTFDMQFRFFDAPTDGTPAGPVIARSGVQAVNGIFTVELDVLGTSFPGSAERWLEISVKQAGSAEPFVTLTPRQLVSSAPYALRSGDAGFADIADIANFSSDTAAVGGTPAAQIIKEGDLRLTDARQPLAGSSNYIQNRTTPQSSTDFNISGSGTLGGNLTANVVTATQFNSGSARVFRYDFATANTYAGFLGNPAQGGTDNSLFGGLAGLGNTGSGNSVFGSSAARSSNTGNDNSVFGRSSGFNNTGGSFNSFFGAFAGFANQTANLNSFFGYRTGQANTLGAANAFLGSNAGFSNTDGQRNTFVGNSAGFNSSTGSRNTIVGDNAGLGNTTGDFNTLLGGSSNVTSGNLTFATAIGAFATVSSSNTIALGRSGGEDTVVIPGPLNANGSGITNLNASNITTGTLAIANGGTGSSVKNFLDLTTNQDVGGNKNFTGNVQHFGGLFSYGSTRFVGLLVHPLVGNGVISIRNAANNNFSQTIFSDETDTFRGYVGYIGSNAGLGARNDTVELGTNGKDLTFRPNNTEVMRFDTSGNIGVGTATPGSKLHVTGESAGSTILNVENTFSGTNDGFAVQGRSVNGPGVGTGGFFTGGRYGVFARADSATGTGTTIGVYGNAIGSAGFRYGVWGEANPGAGAVSGTGVIARAIGPSSTTNIGVEGFASGAPTNWAGYFWGGNTYVENSLAVGTTAPNFKLHVIEAGNTGLRVQTNTPGGTVASFGGNGEFRIDSPGFPGGRLTVLENGNVGIGNFLPSERLAVNGNVSLFLATGGVTNVCHNAQLRLATCSSSIRYKQHIRPYGSGRDLINRLRPVTFNWKADNKEDLGLIAEEVAEIEPLLATYNDKGEVEGVKYDRVGVLLINVVKEQQAQIDRQERLLAEQQKQLAALKKLLCSIKQDDAVCGKE